MYLLHTHEAQAILYLERDNGKTLAILDVTDPAKMKAIGQVSVDVPYTYDFVQYVGNLRALIHYRNHSGFAVLNFKNYKQPLLVPEPEYLHPATVQAEGPSGLMLVSSSGSSANAASTPTGKPEYEAFNILNSATATPLATVQGVIQRVDRPQTGTIFLLNDQGVTVVRCLAVEREHQTEVWQKDEN